jgi:LacI family transcriptional regulator
MSPLSSSARKRVALLVSTKFAPGRDRLRGIAQFAHEVDTWRLINVPGGDTDPIQDWLLEIEFDGVIGHINDHAIAEVIKARGIPVVDDRIEFHDADSPHVDIDNEAVAALAAEHFFDRGFHHVAFYPFENNREAWSQNRGEALRKLCSGRASFHLYKGPMDQRQGTPATRRHVRAWLRQLPKPVAIMLARDDRGLVVLDACREEGLLVPEQVAVLGVDNDQPLCDLTFPPLSSVRMGHRELGYESARMLDTLMDGDDPPDGVKLFPPLGIATRRSSETRAIDDEAVALGVHLIHENLASDFTNDSLARSANISRSLFQQRFRKAMGKTIRDYITDLRLERAKDLIVETDRSLSEIAWAVGFKRHEYMGHVFTNRLAITPGSLRK